MRVVSTAVDLFQVALDQEEIRIIRAALNEVCNGIDIREFETRLGASRAKVGDLLSNFQNLRQTQEP